MTTTPWTLPANVALAVRADAMYGLFAAPPQAGDRSQTDLYILASSLAEEVFGEGNYRRLKIFTGEALVGLRYQPLLQGYVPEGEDLSQGFRRELCPMLNGTIPLKIRRWWLGIFLPIIFVRRSIRHGAGFIAYMLLLLCLQILAVLWLISLRIPLPSKMRSSWDTLWMKKARRCLSPREIQSTLGLSWMLKEPMHCGGIFTAPVHQRILSASPRDLLKILYAIF